MKKLFIVFLSTILLTSTTIAQSNSDSTSNWQKGGIVTLNYSQVALSNWAAGGNNSQSGNGMVNLFANFKSGDNTWDNTLDMGYGIIRQGNKNNNTLRKSDDKIDLASKYGRKSFMNFWYYSMLLGFKTQFSNGYNYPNDSVAISKFMAPGALIFSIGMDYKEGDNFSLFISPATGKATFVNDKTLADAGAYGVAKAIFDENGKMIKPGEKQLYEFGGYFKAMYKSDIMENVRFQTKLDLFTNYMKNPENIVINWETLISMKINKYISATLSTQLIYDDKVATKIDDDGDGVLDVNGPRVQLKEIFGVGFSYKL